MSSSKAIDYHRRVEGRDRRITLSSTSAKCIFLLNRKLGHRTVGETIEWLLCQVKPTIDAIISGRRTTTPIFPPRPLRFWRDPSMAAASKSNALALPLIPSNFQNKNFLAPVGSVFTFAKGSLGNDDDDDDNEDAVDKDNDDLQKYFRL